MLKLNEISRCFIPNIDHGVHISAVFSFCVVTLTVGGARVGLSKSKVIIKLLTEQT